MKNLSDFAPEGHIPVVKKYEFKDCFVLAVDQALKHAGLINLHFNQNKWYVYGTNTYNYPLDVKGTSGVLDGALAFYQDFCLKEISSGFLSRSLWGIATVLYEEPPVANRVIRPESSLLAAHSIRIACAGKMPCVSVNAQKAKTRWTGIPSATKAQVRKSLIEKFPEETSPLLRDKSSEHVWDALLLALEYAVVK